MTIADAEWVISHPLQVDCDEKGKSRYTGEVRGVCVRVVVALDEPDWIVTIHERGR
jgi:hypothetical protein